ERASGGAAAGTRLAHVGPPLPGLVEVTGADFEAGVEASPLPVLADFWAPWWGPCRMVAPAVEKVAADLAGKVKVVKINTDEQPDLGSRLGVRSIPTLILFERCREKDRVVGVRPAPALRAWIDSKLSASAA